MILNKFIRVIIGISGLLVVLRLLFPAGYYHTRNAYHRVLVLNPFDSLTQNRVDYGATLIHVLLIVCFAALLLFVRSAFPNLLTLRKLKRLIITLLILMALGIGGILLVEEITDYYARIEKRQELVTFLLAEVEGLPERYRTVLDFREDDLQELNQEQIERMIPWLSDLREFGNAIVSDSTVYPLSASPNVTELKRLRILMLNCSIEQLVLVNLKSYNNMTELRDSLSVASELNDKYGILIDSLSQTGKVGISRNNPINLSDIERCRQIVSRFISIYNFSRAKLGITGYSPFSR